MNNHILSLLGLALRGGRLAIGEEPTALAAKSGQARLLLLASDAAGNTLRRTEFLAQEGHCLWLTLPFTKAELGGALGRGSAAVAALTDTGLAAAVTERLATLDPEHYGEIAARMDLKRRRAKERQSAPRRDPPKKAPTPEREDRRPPGSRWKGGPSGRDRPRSPDGVQKPAGHRDGKQGQPHHAKRDRRPSGKDHPYAGKTGGGRPQGGTPGRPRTGRPAGRPPWNKGTPRSGGRSRGPDRGR